VAELLLYVRQRLALLHEQARLRLPQVVQPDLPYLQSRSWLTHLRDG
jgi:hypothetical protein